MTWAGESGPSKPWLLPFPPPLHDGLVRLKRTRETHRRNVSHPSINQHHSPTPLFNARGMEGGAGVSAPPSSSRGGETPRNKAKKENDQKRKEKADKRERPPSSFDAAQNNPDKKSTPKRPGKTASRRHQIKPPKCRQSLFLRLLPPVDRSLTRTRQRERICRRIPRDR